MRTREAAAGRNEGLPRWQSNRRSRPDAHPCCARFATMHAGVTAGLGFLFAVLWLDLIFYVTGRTLAHR